MGTPPPWTPAMAHECSTVIVRGCGSSKKNGDPIEFVVPMLGPVSGTRRIASEKCFQAANTASSEPEPNSDRATFWSRSSRGGASVQLYQARKSEERRVGKECR